MKLFISPHNDDAALFGAFTIMTHQPLVLTVFDSYVQPARGFAGCDAATRRAEDVAAMVILGTKVEFLGLHDDGYWINPDGYKYIAYAIKNAFACVPDEVWIPALDDTGHVHHNMVNIAGRYAFKGFCDVRFYATYNQSGKVRSLKPVPRDGAMARLKLQALACYQSQFGVPNCVDHFLRSQEEYIIEAAS